MPLFPGWCPWQWVSDSLSVSVLFLLWRCSSESPCLFCFCCWWCQWPLILLITVDSTSAPSCSARLGMKSVLTSVFSSNLIRSLVCLACSDDKEVQWTMKDLSNISLGIVKIWFFYFKIDSLFNIILQPLMF